MRLLLVYKMLLISLSLALLFFIRAASIVIDNTGLSEVCFAETLNKESHIGIFKASQV